MSMLTSSHLGSIQSCNLKYNLHVCDKVYVRFTNQHLQQCSDKHTSSWSLIGKSMMQHGVDKSTITYNFLFLKKCYIKLDRFVQCCLYMFSNYCKMWTWFAQSRVISISALLKIAYTRMHAIQWSSRYSRINSLNTFQLAFNKFFILDKMWYWILVHRILSFLTFLHPNFFPASLDFSPSPLTAPGSPR